MTDRCTPALPMASGAYIGNIFAAIFNEQMGQVEKVGRFQSSGTFEKRQRSAARLDLSSGSAL